MRRRPLGAATLLVLACGLLTLPASADAAFAITEFQAAASRADASPESQAGAHPYALRLDLGLETEAGAEPLRELTVHMPPGLLVNPTAVTECPEAAFHTPRSGAKPGSLSGESCPNPSQVGVIEVDVGGTVRSFGLFNLVAPFGTTVALGASPFGVPLVFTGTMREADAGLDLHLREAPQGIDLRALHVTIWGTPWWGDARVAETHDPQRGNCLNEEDPSAPLASDCQVLGVGIEEPESLVKSYLTLPTTPCGTAPAFSVEASAWDGAAARGGAAIAPLLKCNKALTTPKLQLMTSAAAARTGLAFNLDVNDGGGILNPGGIARPAIKTAVVSLPEGLTLNPSLGAGLGVCSEAEFARESATSEPGAGCPNAAKIGDVTVEGVLGLAEPVKGSLYLASPHDNPFGTLLAVYLLARSPRRGIALKSVGKIEPDPRSGRLVAIFDQLPRLLYTHFGLTLREGQRSTLVSPSACGTYRASLEIASWAEPSVFTPDASFFAIDRGDGGPCPSGAIPPFAPALLAGSLNPAAGAYTPFYLRMSRSDAEGEITSYSATFPPGLLAKIAGVSECSDAAIAAATHRSGAEEQAAPSCPDSSRIGRTVAGYGVGGVLAWAPGGLYLAGPYHGAPLSVVAIDAAKIGPLDLGTVLVRQAIRLDPRSAQASIDAAGSDPIPHILQGIPLHLRDVRVFVERPGFIVNATSCDPMQVSSRLTGAGADPFSPADDTSATSTERYQLFSCSVLGFRPRLALRLLGSTRHGGFPSLRATYLSRPGDANLSAISVTLPPSLILAQQHIDQVCTRAQFAAGGGGGGACPAGSIYGRARAVTPLMSEPLEGPVYLRSSRTAVPDLVAALRGHGIEIEVPGRIDSSRGGIRANFESLPDAPVSRFTMRLAAGKRGLLANGAGLCPQHGREGRAGRANARFVAQNNEAAIGHLRIAVRCKGKARRGRRHSKPARGGKR